MDGDFHKKQLLSVLLTHCLVCQIEALLQTKTKKFTAKLSIMMKIIGSKKEISMIGEEIGLELGKEMVKDFQVAHPNEIQFFNVGKNIINQILNQPGCEGIRFYNAYNEMGEKTLVYVGLTSEGKALLTYSVIDNKGQLSNEAAIVADRVVRGGGDKGGIYTADDWTWETE